MIVQTERLTPLCLWLLLPSISLVLNLLLWHPAIPLHVALIPTSKTGHIFLAVTLLLVFHLSPHLIQSPLQFHSQL